LVSAQVRVPVAVGRNPLNARLFDEKLPKSCHAELPTDHQIKKRNPRSGGHVRGSYPVDLLLDQRRTTGQVRVRVAPSMPWTLPTTSRPSSSRLRASATAITS